MATTSVSSLSFLGIAGNFANDKFDDEGNLTDEERRREVRDLLVSLATWTRRLGREGDAAVAS